MKHHRCNWPRGKVIGGSSVLNYMLYVRGNKKDYDIWESLGNPGWGSEEALYYFKKSEDNRNPYLARTPYHSTGGYLTVQEAPWHTPLAAAFVQAGVEMGYVFTENPSRIIITSIHHTRFYKVGWYGRDAIDCYEERCSVRTFAVLTADLEVFVGL
jgi:choline dehydrogenase-like flavoprotein